MESRNQGATTDRHDVFIPPLFRLPAELRIMIYEYTFADGTVHVQPKSTDTDLYLLRLRGDQKHQAIRSLLMACRIIREEATPVFNECVIFDFTTYHNSMAAVYELEPGICQSIKAIEIDPALAKTMAVGLQLGFRPTETYRQFLPSLQHVYIKHSPHFGLLVVSHDTAIRALRLYLGNMNLGVHFFE
ncbi:hypothetical protein BDW02DRAFT_626487 [Decorospora gaudefroyi]|uniref:2EXR domain-containing protein n=1 Tax=Decorospora gaudefroyi TaxID=184978 RepID=A0A6A5KW29_9PLEO|nr:hypothetical protein BDW02DRAFT_626487 [Decorospora gaudefroyi]